MNRLSPETEWTIAHVYEKGFTAQQVAYIIGVSAKRTVACLKRQGVTLRGIRGTRDWYEVQDIADRIRKAQPGYQTVVKVNRRIKGGI